MNIDILKNPILIGLFMGVVTYIYLSWSNNKKDKKSKEDSDRFNIIIKTVVVSAISWFVAYSYFGSSEPIIQTNQMPTMPIMAGGFVSKNNINLNNVNDVSYSPTNQSKSIHLIGKGINIPQELPDVFIETI